MIYAVRMLKFVIRLVHSLQHLLSCKPRVTVTSRFVYKAIRDLESINHLFINPIRRIGLIHKCSLDSRWLKWLVQVNVLLNNCKQRITSLSLLVGTTVSTFANPRFYKQNNLQFTVAFQVLLFFANDKRLSIFVKLTIVASMK